MVSNQVDLFCSDLQSNPQPEMGKILVTGANGYIGGRLIPELIARGYQVRILIRKESPELLVRWPGIEISIGDALNPEDLLKALNGIHTAYYLIHSLKSGRKKFEKKDLKAARNFRNAAENQNINRIIYLGALGNTKKNLSSHLDNRIKVAQELSGGSVPVTVLRAAMIIGSGSASYEILKNLVENTPIFILPKWAKTRSQPISIRGVIQYLVGTMEIKETAGKEFDIGGNEIISYQKMLRVMTNLLGKKRYFFRGFVNSTVIYGYIASLLTHVPPPITRSLLVSCKNEVLCLNGDINKHLNIKLLSFKEALIKALTNEGKDTKSTGYPDSFSSSHKIAI